MDEENSNQNEDNLQKIEPPEMPSETADTKKDDHYGADSIVVLEGLEGVRKRPAIYTGSTGKRGWHHLAYEIIDNGIDEALAGYCTHIEVTLEKDESLRIRDNGRGIPVAPHPVKKIPTIEVIFTTLHSGGKFDKNSYKVSGGLHGVGLSVVNACSEWAVITVLARWKEISSQSG